MEPKVALSTQWGHIVRGGFSVGLVILFPNERAARRCKEVEPDLKLVARDVVTITHEWKEVSE